MKFSLWNKYDLLMEHAEIVTESHDIKSNITNRIINSIGDSNNDDMTSI